MAASSRAGLLLVAVVAVVASLCPAVVDAWRYPPLVKGLSFDFYKTSCPQAESVARDVLASAARQNPGLLPALIRIHFHDCFVQGCDASVLLDNTTTETSEKTYIPNQTLRPAAFALIDAVRARLEKACGGRVVSCADVAALAARDAVRLAGGPGYAVPLGRRDGLRPANQSAVFAGLPPPTSDVTGLMAALSKIGLDETDLVALSGGHTVGVAHCPSFDDRLFPTRDPTMNEWFFNQLRQTCPVPNTAGNTTVNDIRTPDAFDNKYYVDLLNRQGLFTSDQSLFTDARTKPLVTKFAVDQNAFFDQFVYSYVKMGMIGVLTGAQGQIRASCAVRNPGASMPWSSVVDTVVEAADAVVSL